MKKIQSILCIVLCTIIITLGCVVYAEDTFSIKLQKNKETLKAGEELEVILEVNNFTEGSKGTSIIQANLEYDKKYFETVQSNDITVLNYWEGHTFNPEAGTILLDRYNPVNEPHEAVKIKLKVKDKIKETTTTEIKLTNIVGTDGDHDIEVADATTTVNIEKSKLFFGSNSQDNNNLFYIIAGVAILVILVGGIVIFVTKKSKGNKENSDK